MFTSWFAGYHHFSLNWTPSAEHKHIANIEIQQKLTVFGIEVVALDASVRQLGPLMVIVEFKSTDLGGFEGALIILARPLDSNKQKIIHNIYMKQRLFRRILSKALIYSIAEMVSYL